MSESVIITGIAVGGAATVYGANKTIINAKINEVLFHYKRTNFSVGFTKYFNFKKQYSLEDVNRSILGSIECYKESQFVDCSYDVDNFKCNILPSFTFAEFDEFEHSEDTNDDGFETYPPLQNDEKFPPKVDSVTIHIVPKNGESFSLSVIQKIIYAIEKQVTYDFDFSKTGSFIYFHFKNEKDKLSIKNYLLKKLTKMDQGKLLTDEPEMKIKVRNKPNLENMIASLL